LLIRKLILLLFICVSFSSVFADDSKFDSLVTACIDQIYSINFDDANQTIEVLDKNYPEHPAPKFFDAMVVWWEILLDLTNEEYDDLFFDKLESVIDFCDEILDNQPDNVDALFFKGGALGFRGRLYGIRHDWFDAAVDGKDALPLVYRAYEIDSSNVDVQLGLGIYNYYAAVVPQKYPMVEPLMFFFPEGNKQEGIDQLNYVAEKGKYARIEAIYFLATLYYNFEENFRISQQYTEKLVNLFPGNPRFHRMLGRVLYRRNYTDSSVAVFKEVLDRGENNMPGYNDQAKRESSYYVALNYKNNSETDSARYYFEMCYNLCQKLDTDEESGFLINTALYLGQLYDKLGMRKEAVEKYEEVLDFRERGMSHELAEQYLETPYRGN
jgi:tetratricopeptide (TPR) repeat protein